MICGHANHVKCIFLLENVLKTNSVCKQLLLLEHDVIKKEHIALSSSLNPPQSYGTSHAGGTAAAAPPPFRSGNPAL